MRVTKTSCDNPRAKLLYLSGYVLGYAKETYGAFDSGFSKSTIDDNFQQLFRSHNIETYACEYVKTDTHYEVFNKARSLVIENNIDFIFGFCYGSFPALYSSIKTNVRGVIMLDTSSTQPTSKILTANLCKPIPPIHMGLVSCPVKLFYSQWANENNSLNTQHGMQVKYLRDFSFEVIPDCSHAVMVEPQRYILMEKIMEFIDAKLPSVYE